MKYIFCYLSFFLTPILTAQDLLFNQQTVSVEEGLSSRSISCAIEDHYGFIWVGSDFGLNRYDGYQAKVYQKKAQLQSNYIYQLYTDADSLIWIQYDDKNRSFGIIHPLTQEIWTFEAFFGDKINFTASDISYTLNNEDNEIYVKLRNGTYYKYFGQKHWEKIGYGSKDIAAQLSYISQTPNNGTWILEDNHCYYFDNKAQLQNTYTIPANTNILGMDINHTPIWYQQSDSSYHFLKLKNNQLQEIEQKIELTTIKNIHFRLNYSPKTTILYNVKYNLFWIQYYQQNYVFNTKTLPSQFDKKESIQLPNTIQKLNFKIVNFNKNNRLLGLTNNLYLINLTYNHFQQIPTNLASDSFHSTRSILIDTSSNIYVQNYNSQSFFWKKNAAIDSIHNLTPILKRSNGAGLSSLLDNDKETIWMGTENAKIVKYHPPTQTVQYYQPCEGELPAFKLWAFWALHQDQDGQIWIGSRDGLHLLDTTQQCIVPYTQYNDYVELAKSIIMHFHHNEQGLWVASNSGLYLIDYKKGVLAHYHSNTTDEQYYIPSDYIVHIHESSTQQFWLSTKGDGLIEWSPKTNQYTQYSKLDGLSNNRIHSVYSDQYENLWMSSDYGLMCMNQETKLITTFLPKDGLSHEEFNLKSHHQDEKGNLYFGGLRGIIKFNPTTFNTIQQTKEEIPLQITDCIKWTEQTQVPINITHEVLKNQTIELYPSDIFLTLRFALIDYKDSKNHQYTYKIDGYTKGWIISNDNFLQLNGLPYGTYNLTIKGRSTLSTWQNNSIQLTLIVYAPFYNTWWFRLLIIGLIGGLVFLYYKYRIRKLEKQKLHLEDTVQERTIKIQEDKQIIEQQATELQKLDSLKSKFFANISHELRTPLTLIKAPLQQLLEQVVINNKINATQLSNIKTAYTNSQKLNQLIDEILLLSKLDAKKLGLESENILLLDFLKQTFNNFKSIANLYQINFQFQTTITADISVNIDWKKLERILYNLLSNAFKFTAAKGQITFEALCPTPNFLTISITDNGTGIHPDDIEHIFDRYYQSKQVQDIEQGGTGIGLALSKEFSELLGGTLTISSTLGKGSKFLVQIPLQLATADQPLSSPYILESQNFLSVPTNSAKHKANILIVEDHEALRTFIANLLAQSYQIYMVVDGQAALEFLEKNEITIDLILSDIMMPRLDGFQLSKKIKATPKWATIPILILSARADQQDKLTALRIGVDDYILKPFDAPELLIRIQNLLHNYQQRKLALSEQSSNSAPKVEQSNWLTKVEQTTLGIIREKQGNFNLPDLAEKLQLSERQFRRRIKTLVGLTPNQYLRELRLKVAKDYLEKKHFGTVQEIAQAVGFNTANHFSKLYAERFGKRPIDYLQ